MENQDVAKYELLVIIGSFAVAFALTYITKKQREKIREQSKERKLMAKELAELKQRFK